MANLLTSRAGQGYSRRPPRRRPSASGAIAALPGQGMESLGSSIEAVAEKAYGRHARKVASREGTEYEVAKMKLISDWEAEKRESGLLDPDGELFAEYAKKNEDNLFSHFTYKPAREAAQNDWLKSSTAAALEYAADDRVKEAKQDQTLLLRGISEAQQFPESPSRPQAINAIEAIRKFYADGRDHPDMDPEAFSPELEEAAIKSVLAQHMNGEAERYPGVYDKANKIMADLYGDDLPEGYKFTLAEVETLKAQYERGQAVKRQEAARLEAEREASMVESVFSDQYLGIGQYEGKGKTRDEMKQIIWQTGGLTNEQRVRYLGIWDAAMDRYHETGIDPWKSPQDIPAHDAMWQRIFNGEPVTPKELEEAWLSGPNGTPLWTSSMQQSLRRDLAGRNSGDTSKYSRTHPMVADYFKHLKKPYTDKKGLVKEKHLQQWATHQQEMDRRMADAFPDAAKMQAEYEAVKQMAFPEGPSAWANFKEWLARERIQFGSEDEGGAEATLGYDVYGDMDKKGNVQEQKVMMRNPDDGFWYNVPLRLVETKQSHGWTERQ